MTNYTIIADINHPSGTSFQVHRTGCKDVTKAAKKAESWRVEAPTAYAAIEMEIKNFEATEQTFAAGDFKILNCVTKESK